MIENDYQKIKEEVLRNYNYFQKNISNLKGLEYIKNQGEEEKIIESIRKLAEDVKNDKFKLMVLGEAKSGKSTFINAYLGVNLLPTGILQCTSSIIKIKYGEKIKLIATKGDNNFIEHEEINKIQRFLKENGAINEKYRDIPVDLINYEIFFKKNGEKIYEKEIDEFINGIMNEKEPGTDDKKYKKLIKEYINSKKDGDWRNLIKEISIEYPFESDDMKGIEIIDSPGVNAIGGLGSITEDYIKNVNAIIFLHSVEVPIESKALQELIIKNSINRDTSFLVLTKAGKLSSKNLEEKFNEAYKYYQNIINKEQILAVDSLLRLYRIEIKNSKKTFEELCEYIDENENSIDPAITACFSRTTKNLEDLIKKIENKSNFLHLSKVVDKFGRKSFYLLAKDFLKTMEEFYKRISSKLEQDKGILDIIDPKIIQEKISKIIAEIEEKEDIANIKVQAIDREYNSIINEKIKYEIEEYSRSMNEIVTFEELEKHFFYFRNHLKNYQENIIKEIQEKCNREIIYTDTINDYSYLIPEFTSEDFEKIKKETEKDSEEVEEYENGITFRKVEYIHKYSQDKHVNKIKDSITDRANEISNKLSKYLCSYLTNTIEKYEKILQKNIDTRKDELKKTEVLYENNEKLIEKKLKIEEILGAIYKSKQENEKIIKVIKKNIRFIEGDRNEII